MRLANRSYTQVKVEISEGLGGGSRQGLSIDRGELPDFVLLAYTYSLNLSL